MHIVTVAEMKELEAQAERQYGLTSPILMQNAGKSAADIFEHQLAPQQTMHDLEILFLLGPGNNGGDGVVMARHLKQSGALVHLYHWKEHQLIANGQEISPVETAAGLAKLIQSADYIIDALLGTGRSRPLPEDMRKLLARVQQEREQRTGLRIMAIDLPTGLNADTGEVDPGTIPADMTITLACPKQGFFFFPGRDYIGDLSIGDIGLPAELEQHLQTEMITGKQVHALLPHRPLNSNKGTFGKVMLCCGSPPYPGSAYLAGIGAARVGGGLITLAVTENMLPIYASAFHEATFVLLPAEDAGSFERAQTLINHLHGYRALLIGPGLGQSSHTREVILQVLEHLRSQPEDKRPHLVIDADGLNNLSALEHWWTLLPQNTLITPHPAEMGRLCQWQYPQHIASDQQHPPELKVSGGGIDRLDLVRHKADEWQVNLVLKGACTIITEPQGHTRINWRSNPALATAGTGDVLAGMIAGLLAQGMQPFDAASAAVYLHTVAADLVTQAMHLSRTGLLASDLLAQIPRAITNSKCAEI
jgi:ADP-dependent NAD(P)H-hydrate dehydratase / NAD(P)H-hydrate epimerase